MEAHPISRNVDSSRPSRLRTQKRVPGTCSEPVHKTVHCESFELHKRSIVRETRSIPSFFTLEKNLFHEEGDDGQTTPRSQARQKHGYVKDAMTYDTVILLDWRVLSTLNMTVWKRFSLWAAVCKLVLLAGLVAMVNLLFLGQAGTLEQSELLQVARPLKFCIGLLLGFFLSVSVQRWWETFDSFASLADSLCNLQKDLCCFGVPQDKSIELLRLGVMSAWLLHLQLLAAMATSDDRCDHNLEFKDFKAQVKKFATGEGHDPIFAAPQPHERDMLFMVDDPSGALWTWFGSLLGRLSEDGWVPPMTSPAYGNLLAHSAKAQAAIRSIKAHTLCQAPYIYVHMLACLVHINNILCAISLGASGAAILSRRLIPEQEIPSAEEVVRQGQDLFLSVFFCLFGPLIYQALFEVAIAMTQPFRQAGALLPTDTILKKLERDLHDGFRAIKLTQWERARFKPGEAPSPPAVSPDCSLAGSDDEECAAPTITKRKSLRTVTAPLLGSHSK